MKYSTGLVERSRITSGRKENSSGQILLVNSQRARFIEKEKKRKKNKQLGAQGRSAYYKMKKLELTDAIRKDDEIFK